MCPYTPTHPQDVFLMNESIITRLTQRLQNFRLHVERIADTLNVSHGEGLMAHKANLDLTSLFEHLQNTPTGPDQQAQQDRLIAGYASGVLHVLLEPARSRARDWTFIESTGGITPNIEVNTFALGAEAASGEPAFVLPLNDAPDNDLVIAYIIHLNRGLRVLSIPQKSDWAVSQDRITSAARSLLYHKTRETRPRPYDDKFPSVMALETGDGYDAARALVFADAFYHDVTDATRFALPSQNTFLFTHTNTPEARAQLEQATAHAFAQADYPLSPQIFQFTSGKPTPAGSPS